MRFKLDSGCGKPSKQNSENSYKNIFKCYTQPRKLKKILINSVTNKGQNAILFLDSGSEISLVSPKFLESINKLHEIKNEKIKLKSFSNDTIPILGSVEIKLKFGNNFHREKYLVSRMVEHDFLIGLDIMEKYDLKIDIPISK